jgi:hypothetical protein
MKDARISSRHPRILTISLPHQGILKRAEKQRRKRDKIRSSWKEQRRCYYLGTLGGLREKRVK